MKKITFEPELSWSAAKGSTNELSSEAPTREAATIIPGSQHHKRKTLFNRQLLWGGVASIMTGSNPTQHCLYRSYYRQRQRLSWELLERQPQGPDCHRHLLVHGHFHDKFNNKGGNTLWSGMGRALMSLLLVLFIRSHAWVGSWGSCLSLAGLLILVWCSPDPSMLL